MPRAQSHISGSVQSVPQVLPNLPQTSWANGPAFHRGTADGLGRCAHGGQVESGRKSPIGSVPITCAWTCSACSQSRTEWHLPWMDSMQSGIREVASYQAARTLFTRFMPAKNPEAEIGQWRTYYRRWQAMTLERIAPELLACPRTSGARPARDCFQQAALLALARRPSSQPSVGTTRRHPHYHGRRNRRVRDRNRTGRGGSWVPGYYRPGCALQRLRRRARRGSPNYDERFNQQVETCTAEPLLSGWQRN